MDRSKIALVVLLSLSAFINATLFSSLQSAKAQLADLRYESERDTSDRANLSRTLLVEAQIQSSRFATWAYADLVTVRDSDAVGDTCGVLIHQHQKRATARSDLLSSELEAFSQLVPTAETVNCCAAEVEELAKLRGLTLASEQALDRAAP